MRHPSLASTSSLVRGWIVALGLLACLAGWTAADHAQAQEAPPLLVGGTVSQSGRFKEISLQMQHGMRLWEKQVNQRGGLLGRPVRLVLHDDQSDPERVRQIYAQLIDQDKVDLLAAPYGSVLTMAAVDVCGPRGKVLMVTAAGEDIWRRGFRTIFGVYATADRYFIGVLDLMARQGLTSVALINFQDPFSRSAARGCREWADRLGLRLTTDLEFSQGEEELPKILERVRQDRPDGLILCSYPVDSFRLIAALRRLGYRPPVLAMTVAPALPDFGAKAGDFAEGILAPSHWEADERMPYPGSRRFIKAFKEMTGLTPSYHAASAFAGLVLLENAARQAGSLDQEKIREHLRELDTVTILGRFKVDRNGRQIGHSPVVIQWQRGQKEIIYPPKMHTAHPLLPRPARAER